MTGPGAPIRRCPECGEEFQPHVVTCSDCGAPLESAFEGDGPPDARRELRAPAPSAEYVPLVSALTPGMAEQAAQHLAAAGIPFGLIADARRGLRLGVAREQVGEAIGILEREAIVPPQPDPAEGAVAAEGGPCPACGDDVAPGSVECPGCGLRLSGGDLCRHCGAELAPGFDACPRCAREQDQE